MARQPGQQQQEQDNDADEEQRVLLKTLSAFSMYRSYMHSVNQLRRTDYMGLPVSHKRLLPGYNAKLANADDLIEMNALVVEAMLERACETMLGVPWSQLPRPLPTPEAGDLEKVRQTVRQLARDWTAEGLPERRECYGPFYRALNRLYPTPEARRGKRILVPGCGLGRMAVDIACMGFEAFGNEFSYHMLIAFSYLVNDCTKQHQHSIAPFIHSFSNHRSNEDMFRTMPLPDLCPMEALPHLTAEGTRTGTVSMYAGEFLESCCSNTDPVERFDAVCTSFFLDTAHDPVAYVLAIRRILREGGIWINLGPLTWHYEGGHGRDNGLSKRAVDDKGAFVGSIELSMEEVMHVVRAAGFVVTEEKYMPNVPYVDNERGLQSNLYNCKFFVAHVPKGESAAAGGAPSPGVRSRNGPL